jgi:glutaredoxin-dependent peroxiredoxin
MSNSTASSSSSSSYTSPPDIGDSAPDFNLADADLKMQKLSDYQGKPMVLAFFPAAESPVCTKEMCTFRDSLEELKRYDAQVLGISVDGPFANKIFTENRHLNFPILSDYNRETIKNYGIVMPNLGPLQGYNAAKRSIFVLDNAGKIRYKWISDNPLVEPNYEEIKNALAKLKTSA